MGRSHATDNKQAQAALFLIQREPSCNVNARDRKAKTPLMLASKHGLVEVMAALMVKGARVGAVDNYGHRALHHAIHNKQTQAVLFLIQRELLWDVNARDRRGKTPLMLASMHGLVEVMAALMVKRVEAVDNDGATALHHAIHNKEAQAALFLIQREPSCDVNARDSKGKTPLMLASKHGLVEVMAALMVRGANVEAVDNDGHRALHHAINNEETQAVLFLLRRDTPCDANALDSQGNTPLMLASKHGLVEVMEELLANGADFADVQDDANMVRSLRHFMAPSLIARILSKSRAIFDATQAGREARRDAAKKGLPRHEQEEKVLDATPAFLKDRVKRGLVLPTVVVASSPSPVEIPFDAKIKWSFGGSMLTYTFPQSEEEEKLAAERMTEELVGVTQQVVENGLSDELFKELLDMMVPSGGEHFGCVLERWEAWQRI